MREQRGAPFAFAWIAAERGALLLQPANATMRVGHPLAEGAVIAERVEHIALDRRTREAQLVALSVDRDQIRSGLGKCRHWHRALIDPRGRATCRDLAREDEIVVACPGEHDLDVCALRSIADHAARDAPTAHRKDSVNEHRASGTG